MINNPTILIVDDDEFLCEMLEDVLTDSGYRVVTARSPREAFDAFADHLFEVVLTDLNLGGASGFEILERLSAEAHSPITILMTTFMNNETEARARELGAHETLCKPFRNDEVIRAIEEARKQKTAGLALLSI